MEHNYKSSDIEFPLQKIESRDMVREVISTMAEGCQLSRLAEDNFLVSSFASRAVAERVANAISKCDETLKVEGQEVKPEPQSEEEEE